MDDLQISNYFEFSRPAAGSNGTNNSSLRFLGSRTILSRLLVAAAAKGEILPISPPFLNSSYQVQFHGPMVQCNRANASVADIMKSVISAQMQTTGNITQTYNAYYAYVPNLSEPGQIGTPIATSGNYSNRSNQLWLSFKRNGTGWTEYPPACPVVEYRVCNLVNASYDLNIAFQDGAQTVSGYPPTILNTVDYPIFDPSKPSDPVQLSYSAFMWAFADLLTGSMGSYNDSSNDPNSQSEYTKIDSDVKNTPLLGSVDLDCFFALDTIYDTDKYAPPSPQRMQDILFARNDTLDDLIPELAFNLTVSLMNDQLLAWVAPYLFFRAITYWLQPRNQLYRGRDQHG
jgi:hypothetical protein